MERSGVTAQRDENQPDRPQPDLAIAAV